MRITYDHEADALYIQLREGEPADSQDLEEGVTADMDAAGHILGIEVLDASVRMGADGLDTIALEHLPLMARS